MSNPVPPSAVVNSASLSVSLGVMDEDATAQVLMGGVSMPIVSRSAGNITFTVNPTGKSPGPQPLVVRNGDGQQSTESVNFTFT